MELIVGFSFGAVRGRPNASTEAIARLIAARVRDDVTRANDWLVVAQWEVASALGDLGVKQDYVVYNDAGRYLTTEDVARRASDYVRAIGVSPKTTYAAAHPDHVKRAVRTLRNVGLPGAHELTSDHIGYDPESDEWWVRSESRFLLRELLASPYYAYRGELW